MGAQELLRREQLKNVIGGTGGSNGGSSCTAAVSCTRTELQNGQWVTVAYGAVMCTSGSGNCTHGTNSVTCDNNTYRC
jgi:hypothetical protein